MGEFNLGQYKEYAKSLTDRQLKRKSDKNFRIDLITGINNKITQQIPTIMEKITSMIFNRAVYYTPIDTGAMLSSIYYRETDGGYKLGYSADYATYVHEIPYRKHEAPSQYKFLEDAAFEIYNEYIKGLGFPVKLEITYEPLTLYIGCKGKHGENLINIKEFEKINKKESTFKRFKEFLENTDEEDLYRLNKQHYEALMNYIVYWGGAGYYEMDDVLKGWLEKTRHELKYMDKVTNK